MTKENFFYTFFLGGKKNHVHSIYVVVFNLSLVEYFSSQLDFYSKLVEKGKKFKLQDTWFVLCTPYSVDC